MPSTALPPPPLLRTASAPARLRSLAPLSHLTPSGQRYRKRKAEEALSQIQVPAAVLSPIRIPAAHLVGTSTRFRREMRDKLPSVRIAGEKAIVAEKERLAETKGTATESFETGAYLTDPLRLINQVTKHSPKICIGGDCGSGFTKIGITYIHRNTTHFSPLLVYQGKDDWQHLAQFLTPATPPFSGDSAHFPNIWAVLQYLIQSKNAFLNGCS